MSTILKTFRLPKACADFIEKESKRREVSEAKVVTDSLKKRMDREAEWQAALLTMASDKEYQREQVEMAEENYD